MKELWKPIPGYNGIYEVSNIGRVKRLARQVESPHPLCTVPRKIRIKDIILKNNTDIYGYHTSTLIKDKTPKTYKVHRLVLLAFVGPSNSVCNHINSVKTDNRLENLEYVSVSENNRHKVKYHTRSKIDELAVKEIRSSSKSNKQLAKKFGVTPKHVWGIKNFYSWKDV